MVQLLQYQVLPKPMQEEAEVILKVELLVQVELVEEVLEIQEELQLQEL